MGRVPVYCYGLMVSVCLPVCPSVRLSVHNCCERHMLKTVVMIFMKLYISVLYDIALKCNRFWWCSDQISVVRSIKLPEKLSEFLLNTIC